MRLSENIKIMRNLNKREDCKNVREQKRITFPLTPRSFIQPHSSAAFRGKQQISFSVVLISGGSTTLTYHSLMCCLLCFSFFSALFLLVAMVIGGELIRTPEAVELFHAVVVLYK